jgi:two-component system KDP operon response regulator KdpE
MPIMMISARGRERDKIEALDLGADDYLSKPFGIGEMLARVKALLRRGVDAPRGPLPPYKYQNLEVDYRVRRARLDGVEIDLTRREFEVLAYFARNAGKVMLTDRSCRPCGAATTATKPTTTGPTCSVSDARSNPTGERRNIC